MEKQLHYLGKTDSGIFCQALFGSAGAFEKTAGAPPFADWATGDALRKYISGITKEDRKKHSYVLVNALGAGEYFGSNINADFFPWNALTHEGTDYGYKTFEHFAHAFQHHKNKDPSKAFGVPVLSVLNHPMKRVELIVRLDRAKAKEEQADGIITRVDGGEFPDVSMGCKVPYDICSICSQKSKTRFDYCQHMQPPAELRGVYGPNKILPDGRKIYVINTLPKFFDISFVFIGADKTAKVMAKVASKGNQVCLGEVCALPNPSPSEVKEIARGYADRLRAAASGEEKTASACCDDCDSMDKIAEAFGVKAKLGEILKTVPVGRLTKALPSLEAQEPDISKDVLDGLSRKHTVGDITGGAASLGIVLKPHEFQRVVLVRMGEDGLADKLDNDRSVFRDVNSVDESVQPDPSVSSNGVRDALRGMVSSRSGLGQPLQLRVIRISVSKIPLPTRSSIEHPLLDKVSAAYNGYRRNLLTKLSQVENVIQNDPSLRNEMLGTTLSGLFTKTANSSLLSLDSVEYMMGAYITNKNLLLSSASVDAVAEYMA